MKNKTRIEELPHYSDNGAIEFFAGGDVLMQSSLQEIRDILEHEGCRNSSVFCGQKALNLDQYEALRTSVNRDCTVDFVIGCLGNVLLMVEAKFRAQSMKKIASTLDSKISHSHDILNSNNRHVRTHPTTVVLLSDNKDFEQKKNKLLRLFRNPKVIVPMRTCDLYTRVFAG